MTAEQKEKLLKLIREKSNANYPDGDYEDWNDIYWQCVKIETDEPK
jgi:hypothetical protein